jgi:hypothetical protein
MKANVIFGMALAAGLLLAAGCATTRPAPKTGPFSETPKWSEAASNVVSNAASNVVSSVVSNEVSKVTSNVVAEPMSFELDEIIASVPVEGANQPYQNLHVGLAAVITPKSSAAACDPDEVEAALHACAPRIAAAILKMVTDSPTLSPHKLDRFRDDLAAVAQTTANQAFARWPHASTCEIEVVVVSLYWTDSSVGRGERAKRSGDVGVWEK